MTQTPPGGDRVLGTLRSVDGRGVVRLENHFDTDIDDLWAAITDPNRLAQWHAQVEGELRPGGTFHRHVEADDWDGTGRVEACEAPRRLVVTMRESEESWRRGQGMPRFEEDGRTTLVAEIRGLPLEPIAYYGVGWQIHVEKLGAYLAGRVADNTKERWDELVPHYQRLAAAISPPAR